MNLKTGQFSSSNGKRLLWITALIFCLVGFFWQYYLVNNISIQCVLESSTAVYDPQNDMLTQQGFFKFCLTGTKKIIYDHPYAYKPQVVVTRKSPDALPVNVERVHFDHVVVRKEVTGGFTGDDYEWMATGRPLYPPAK